ncbi:MAG: hypothetical protein R3F31_24820 [Verrucomicrobiales bacterium]
MVDDLEFATVPGTPEELRSYWQIPDGESIRLIPEGQGPQRFLHMLLPGEEAGEADRIVSALDRTRQLEAARAPDRHESTAIERGKIRSMGGRLTMRDMTRAEHACVACKCWPMAPNN